MGIGTPSGPRREDTKGLGVLDLHATMALPKSKRPKKDPIDQDGRVILRRVLTVALNPQSRIYTAHRTPTPMCPFCHQRYLYSVTDSLHGGDGDSDSTLAGGEETREHMIWRCPAWAEVRRPYLIALRATGLDDIINHTGR